VHFVTAFKDNATNNCSECTHLAFYSIFVVLPNLLLARSVIAVAAFFFITFKSMEKVIAFFLA